MPSIYVEHDKSVSPLDLKSAEFYSSDYYVDKLLSYFQQRPSSDQERPFFAYLPFSAPHWPLQAPKENITKYRNRYNDGPEVLRQQRIRRLKDLGLVPEHAIPHEVIGFPQSNKLAKEWDTLSDDERAISARTMEAYAGMVDRMDQQIGRVLKYLRETGELDNTFVLFMSDNGAEGLMLEAVPLIGADFEGHLAKYYDNSLENIGNYNSFVWYGPRWASAGTAPARLYKTFTSEGGIRVPFVLRYPPLTSGRNGAIEHSFCTVMDLCPTILELAGVKHPGTIYKGRQNAPLRGRSWVQYLHGDSSGIVKIHPEDHIVAWELFGRMGIRQGKWKAVFIPKPFGPARWQLYDLDQDPGETKDLAEIQREKMDTLLAAYKEYVLEMGIGDGQFEYGTFLNVQ